MGVEAFSRCHLCAELSLWLSFLVRNLRQSMVLEFDRLLLRVVHVSDLEHNDNVLIKCAYNLDSRV